MRKDRISRKQISIIHVGRRELALSDDEYRALVYAVTGKRSCLELSRLEGKAVIEALGRAGFRPRGAPATGKATDAQVAFIKTLWREAARQPSDAYLSVWLLRGYAVERPEDLTFDDASRAIEALKAMKRRATATTATVKQ